MGWGMDGGKDDGVQGMTCGSLQHVMLTIILVLTWSIDR